MPASSALKPLVKMSSPCNKHNIIVRQCYKRNKCERTRNAWATNVDICETEGEQKAIGGDCVSTYRGRGVASVWPAQRHDGACAFYATHDTLQMPHLFTIVWGVDINPLTLTIAQCVTLMPHQGGRAGTTPGMGVIIYTQHIIFQNRL